MKHSMYRDYGNNWLITIKEIRRVAKQTQQVGTRCIGATVER